VYHAATGAFVLTWFATTNKWPKALHTAWHHFFSPF